MITRRHAVPLLLAAATPAWAEAAAAEADLGPELLLRRLYQEHVRRTDAGAPLVFFDPAGRRIFVSAPLRRALDRAVLTDDLRGRIEVMMASETVEPGENVFAVTAAAANAVTIEVARRGAPPRLRYRLTLNLTGWGVDDVEPVEGGPTLRRLLAGAPQTRS